MPNEQMLVAGRRYRVPVFLLKKDGDEFLFREPGPYIVRMTLEELPGKPVVSAGVDVVQCQTCDLESYREALPSIPCLKPFCGGIAAIANFAGLDAPYLKAFEVYCAYSQGSSLLAGLNGVSPDSELFSRDRVEQWIEEGMACAQAVGYNVGYFQAMAARRIAIVEKSPAPLPAAQDMDGNIWLGP